MGRGADVCESGEGHWVSRDLTLGFPHQLPITPITELSGHTGMTHDTTHQRDQHLQLQQAASGPKCEETDLAEVRQSEKG